MCQASIAFNETLKHFDCIVISIILRIYNCSLKLVEKKQTKDEF